MEVTSQSSIKNRISKIFLKDPLPFSSKRDMNWSAVKKFGGFGILAAVILVLCLPNPKEDQIIFHEKTDPGQSSKTVLSGTDPTQDTLAQLQSARSNAGAVPRSLDSLMQGGVPNTAGTGPDRKSPMIVSRDGSDSKNQLPPGSRFSVVLIEKTIVGSQAMPIIGVVKSDVIQEDSVAIPKGSKLFGDANFDESSERAHVNWRSVRLPDGRERQISAISVGRDGQAGIDGLVHSQQLKNAIGQTVTRFIAAYAEGSMQKGPLGASQGGADNGLKYAVAQTAQDRANAWGEEMKKEKKWLELKNGDESNAVLVQPFSFRDPGVTYGR